MSIEPNGETTFTNTVNRGRFCATITNTILDDRHVSGDLTVTDEHDNIVQKLTLGGWILEAAFDRHARYFAIATPGMAIIWRTRGWIVCGRPIFISREVSFTGPKKRKRTAPIKRFEAHRIAFRGCSVNFTGNAFVGCLVKKSDKKITAVPLAKPVTIHVVFRQRTPDSDLRYASWSGFSRSGYQHDYPVIRHRSSFSANKK